MNKPNFFNQLFSVLSFKEITAKCLSWNQSLERPETQPTGPLALALKDAYVKDFFRCFEQSRKNGNVKGNIFYTTTGYLHKFISETMSHRQISNIIAKFQQVGLFVKSQTSHKFNKNKPALHCLRLEVNKEWLEEKEANLAPENKPKTPQEAYVSPTSRSTKTQTVGDIIQKISIFRVIQNE